MNIEKILKDHKLWLEDKGGKRAYLRGADLEGADLREAFLEYTNLTKADLRHADLRMADLRCADLEGADLEGADLRHADLRYAKLKTTKGLRRTKTILKMFEKTKDGYIVYKSFGEYYSSPKNWIIKVGSIIEERLDIDRRNVCSYGINVGAKKWVEEHCQTIIYKCLIPNDAEICAPHATDGKVRCNKLKILEVLK